MSAFSNLHVMLWVSNRQGLPVARGEETRLNCSCFVTCVVTPNVRAERCCGERAQAGHARSNPPSQITQPLQRVLHSLQPGDALGQQQRSELPSFMQAPGKSEHSSGLAARPKALSTKVS